MHGRMHARTHARTPVRPYVRTHTHTHVTYASVSIPFSGKCGLSVEKAKQKRKWQRVWKKQFAGVEMEGVPKPLPDQGHNHLLNHSDGCLLHSAEMWQNVTG